MLEVSAATANFWNVWSLQLSPLASRTVLLVVMAFFVLSGYGQTEYSTPKQDLIEAVSKRATRLGEKGAKMESSTEIRALYADEATKANMTMPELVEAYEAAYSAAKKRRPWWMSLKPKSGWLPAVFLFLLLIFRDILKEIIVGFVKAFKKSTYNWVASRRLFQNIALRHYRAALTEKYMRIKIPFRPDRPLAMNEVFVPLKVKGSSDRDQFDAYRAIRMARRLMVTGEPGSGKSMLMKSIVVAYSDGRLEQNLGFAIPILLELNRLNLSDASIEEHLVEMLRLNDFPNGENFVKLGLKEGFLMLLFDGLDEVNSQQKEAVVGKITDLLDAYRKCSAIITCRTAVYNGEFDNAVERTLDIVEFSDQQIRRFLISWREDMPADKSIEQLLETLRERPKIMALARNPMLLTIIAYLYTDTEFILPQSRAEFYDQATDVLLRLWKQERNRYKAPNKRLVLEHLALFIQDSGTEDSQDRRSIDRKTVLREIKRVLPDLNLPDEAAAPILDEIVERIGLMLAIDGGDRYQFAHLSLQEFFAAAALREDGDGLFVRFERDKGTWREVAKLWCGQPNECTGLIETIFKTDPITAFECLADAQMVGSALADRILNHFKERLAEPGEAVVRAFAITAADLRPCGEAIFAFLEESLRGSPNAALRTAAANALALTYLPRAAQVLADCSYGGVEAREALVRMGDLAVPALTDSARSDFVSALDDLQAIGTPLAAVELIPFLWHSNQELAVAAATCLGTLLSKPDIESRLMGVQLTESQRKADWLDWIWAPFAPETSLAVIVGRIAWLIDSSTVGWPKTNDLLDHRLVIPLCAINLGEHIYTLESVEETKKTLEEASSYRSDLGLGAFLDKIQASPKLHFMLKVLSGDPRRKLFSQLAKGPRPTTADWANIFKPTEFQFRGSPYSSFSMLIVMTITLGALYQLWWAHDLSAKSGWSIFFLIILSLIILVNVLINQNYWSKLVNIDNADMTPMPLTYVLGPLVFIPELIRDIKHDKLGCSIYLGIIILATPISFLFIGWLPVVGFYTTEFLLEIGLPIISVVTIQLSWWLGLSILLIVGLRRDRLARNPLYGLLNDALAEPSKALTRKSRLLAWRAWRPFRVVNRRI